MAAKAPAKLSPAKPLVPPKPSVEALRLLPSPSRRSLRLLNAKSPVQRDEAVSGAASPPQPPPAAKPELPARTVPPKPQLLPKPQLPPKPSPVKQAPVARLEEFSLPNSPVRPPRGFRPRAPCPSSPPARPKPQLVPPLETRIKSFSLGRDAEPPTKFNFGSDAWPVRPPRKKNRSEVVVGHQLGRSVSLFSSIEEAERNIPIYATVNYNLKKNRRGQGTQSSKSADFLNSSAGKKYTFAVFNNNNSSAELLDQSNDTLDRSEVYSEQSQEILEVETEHKKIYESIESNLRTIHRDIEDLKENFRRSCENLLDSPGQIKRQSPARADLISAGDKAPPRCMGNSECSSSLLGLCAKRASKSPSPPEKNPAAESNDDSSSRLDEFFSATDSVHGSLNDIMPDILDQDEARVKAQEDNESFGSAENISDSNYVTMSDAKEALALRQKNGSRSFLGRKKRYKNKKDQGDGELSTGVLGDLDSDTARSVDEINPQEENPERKTSIFALIRGKQGRKSKDKKDMTKFYAKKPPSITINSDFETEPEEEEDEEGSSQNLSGNSKLSIEPTVSTNSINSSNSNVSETDTNSDLSESQKRALKAFKTAEELMTSERTYVDSLKLLCVDFRSYVKVQSGKDAKNHIISDADLNKILNHLPQLLALNEDLLRDLENRIVSWNENEKIADIIVKKGPFLKLYTSYMHDFETQMMFLDECCHRSAAFGRVVHEFEALPRCNRLRLSHFMLTPVQRFTKYKLLLQQYLHYLDEQSPDFKDTQAAIQIVSEVAEHANKSMKEGDALSKMLKLQSLLGCELIKPGRVLLRQGELQKICRKGMQPRYFILFSDCLLYTSYHGSGLLNGLKLNIEIPLQTIQVKMNTTEDYRNEFSIISIKRSFTLVASSAKERDEWVAQLREAVKDKVNKQQSFQQAKLIADGLDRPMTTLGHTAPLWIPDDRVTTCQNCAVREFSLTHRRHHCRACGYVVCSECSTNKALLRYIQYQAARVCDKCYDILQREFDDPLFSLPADLSNEAINDIMDNAKIYYRKSLPSSKKARAPAVPQRLLEVTAMEAECTIKGWLQRLVNRSWKRMWFVLKEQVLYAYKASEDVVAIETTPVLGFTVERPDHMVEGVGPELVFTLSHKTNAHMPQQSHSNVPKLVFHAEFKDCADRWIEAFKTATVLN